MTAPQPAPAAPATGFDMSQWGQPLGGTTQSPFPASMPAGQFTAPGQVAPYALPAPMAPASPFDHLTQLMQALQHRQIPQLPGAVQEPSTPMAPAPAADGLGLLRVILGNPQFQQALFGTHRAPLPSRQVSLPLPFPGAPHRARSAQIPLGAVMNAIATLAGQSMSELNAETTEDEPEVPPYLVGDDGDFLVDPANASDRAALVTHLFRMSEALQTAGTRGGRSDHPTYFESELDESEEFALGLGM